MEVGHWDQGLGINYLGMFCYCFVLLMFLCIHLVSRILQCGELSASRYPTCFFYLLRNLLFHGKSVSCQKAKGALVDQVLSSYHVLELCLTLLCNSGFLPLHYDCHLIK